MAFRVGLKRDLIDLKRVELALGVAQLHGGGWIGRETSDEVDNLGSRQLPRDGTIGFKDFGCWLELGISRLGTRSESASSKPLDGTHYQLAAHSGETVVESFGGVV